MEERLQKIMARAGLGSRRQNESLIEAGRVHVNGKVATLGDRADPDQDTIIVDGREIELEPPVYIMLNKPKGVISSTEDELNRGRTTVRDLVDLPGHLYPVGRLDRQSRGLMLLTNDGDLAHKLTHPRFGHEKVYKVLVEGVPNMETLKEWSQGVYLDGKKTLPAVIEVMQTEKVRSHLRITMREGKKRQIRKIGAMLGHPVKQLTRIRLGTLTLGDLRPGQWRHLTGSEIAELKRSVRNKKQLWRKKSSSGKKGRRSRRSSGGRDKKSGGRSDRRRSGKRSERPRKRD